ncbi:MAG TPA: hypothetical protein VFD30_14070 [Terriglobia bacterium]|nr:hypothetical protein [Terriglobia bacterium]
MSVDPYDHQIFVPAAVPSRSSFSFVGLLLLLGVLAIGGFTAYKYVVENRLFETDKRQNAIEDLSQRLRTVEQRLDRIERGRKTVVAAPSAPVDREGVRAEPQPSNPTPPFKGLKISPTRPLPSSLSSPQAPMRLSEKSPELGSLREEVSATRHEPEAATDPMNTVVGEPGAQQAEVARTRPDLSQMADRLHRSIVPFELQTKVGQQRVGPVCLWLRSTDAKNQRYNMRVLVADKWVELKNRTLHEAVDLYMPASQLPMELVVSEIRGGQVRGQLAVPPNTNGQ